MQGDDAELTAAVRAAQEGDECAFRTVYRAVQPRLLGYVRTLVPDPDAEDIASEAWLQIARDMAGFSGDADRFRGWTARIARNRALDHVRMRARRPAVGGDESELVAMPGAADTADEAMESLGTGRAIRFISRLPRDQAEAVVLRVVMGLDAKSAAQVLGKRSGAVRTAAHRGLRKLAELLEADGLNGAVPLGGPGGADGPEGADEPHGVDDIHGGMSRARAGGSGRGMPPEPRRSPQRETTRGVTHGAAGTLRET
ncbi:hypothetical protein N566_10060 [Streptomycetaceae bacterium MP113-05]|nr:hypothetical protein N566_10060 [Streptomycetaceae bacterium MP113-05]